MRQTNKEDEAAREEGVPLQWSIATESSNSSTFMVTPAATRQGCPLQLRPLLYEHRFECHVMRGQDFAVQTAWLLVTELRMPGLACGGSQS